MTTPEQKQVHNDFNASRAEINALRNRLNELDSQKEKWFKEKEDAQAKISDLIKAVKSLKEERDSLTKDVKDSKSKREELNKDINKNISEIKEVTKEKSEATKKFKIEKDPSWLRKEIEKLEFAIETQPMSFDKEQKTMKLIKEKKKQLAEVQKLTGVYDKMHSMSKGIDSLKKEANKIHKDITVKASTSQKKHEEMLVVSKQIDELKKTEEEAHKRFIEFKKEFTEVNRQLKDKLDEMSALSEKISGQKMESAKQRRKKEEELLKNKEEAVEDKIKKKKKLTTEDLLVFQRNSEE